MPLLYCPGFYHISISVSLEIMLFGYTIYSMFFILPTPLGLVGSNEVVGLLSYTLDFYTLFSIK